MNHAQENRYFERQLPEKGGNTSALVKAFTEGAESVGNTVTEFFLDGMDIHGCKGCFGGNLPRGNGRASVLLTAAESRGFENVSLYYDHLTEHLRWKNLGCVLAGGNMDVGDISEKKSSRMPGIRVNPFKEALIKSTCADLRRKFLLTRKENAGILTDFKFF